MTPEKPIDRPILDWRAPERPNLDAMEGRYVRLERLQPDLHAADLHRANSANTDIWNFLSYGPFTSAATYHRWVREITEGNDPLFYAIKPHATGNFSGVASYLRISPEVGSIEVGHVNFSQELQRTPAATEAIFLMMSWAFEAGYRRFEWKCDAGNIGSRRAAQRFGFSYEGLFRQATIVRGRNRDTAWFACIDADWPALKEAFTAWLDPSNFDAEGRQIESLKSLTGLVRVTSDPAL
ncbi:GNAT family protein [uncultured Litoreibacter sp.]|uniref:GNAT family N-acetyltransferase n=1 Tax=uncultured Litoreibacter sp. TaxID=1392394 RepID=UPI00260CFA4A|nr:GNAT family protein [uncultured Litoreibacter sp.]